MIEHRPGTQLGGSDFGWLKASHHFAIGAHGNPAHRPIGNLYVWNDDEIAPGSGFPFHPHANVEIVTYVREGIITHRDNCGNRGETHAGDVQVMSAGTGIRHTEVNVHAVPTRIFQIWLNPREKNGPPRWGSRPFPKADRAGRLVVLASGFPEDTDSLAIRADARVMGATLPHESKITYPLIPGRKVYLVPAHGRVMVNGIEIEARDGAALFDESVVDITALENAELVLVETA